MDIITLSSFDNELRKIAGAKATAAAGAAIGAGGMALRGALKEWDARVREHSALAKMTPENREAAKTFLSEPRRHRLARLGATTLLGAGAGAGAGYFGHKAVDSLSRASSSNLQAGMSGAMKEGFTLRNFLGLKRK